MALSAPEARRIREGIADAVLSGPDGLREALERDEPDFLRLIAASRAGAEETSRLLRESIAGARRAGHSWDAIGRVLGVSRQAAQQRFAPAPAPAADDAPDRRTLTPLTALDEMEVLAREGRAGWHVVDSGPFFHVVERSDHPWEHRRAPLAVGPRLRRLEDEGWIPVSSWFPWRYLKRPLPPGTPG